MSLFDAVARNDITEIKKLLDNGADVNERNIDKYKDLMKGSSITKDSSNWTPLMLASRYSNTLSSPGVIKLLLEYEADPNLKDNKGWTALMLSARHSNTGSNTETVKLLLENGADPNMKTNGGWTALIMSAKHSNDDSNIETVRLLVENGADPNMKNNDGRTALMLSVKYSNKSSNIETVKLLLEYGADPFVNLNCPTEECKQLINKYRWEKLYKRDLDTSRRYSANSKDISIPKEIWELILLEKRRQMLCSNLSSDKNKEILYLFALEFNIPVTENTSKAQLCAMISRYLVYGKHPKPLERGKREMDELKNKVREIAYKFGLDPEEEPDKLLQKLSQIVNMF